LRSAQKKVRDPNSKNKLGMVRYACYPNHVGEVGRSLFETGPGKNARPYLKNN
jgi:hypothetical protein